MHPAKNRTFGGFFHDVVMLSPAFFAAPLLHGIDGQWPRGPETPKPLARQGF